MDSMEVEKISKLKSVALVFIMLAFATVVMLEGVAIGDEQSNIEQPITTTTTTTTTTVPPGNTGGAGGNVDQPVPGPVLEISKTMTSGKTTVYTNTKESWTLEIAVTYDYCGGGRTCFDYPSLADAVVSDTLPPEITLDSITVSKGSVSTSTKGEATKLTWTIGNMGSPGTETLTMDISTRTTESSGGRMGRMRMTTTTQYFLEAGEYNLNEGAFVSGTEAYAGGPANFDNLGTIITAGPTDPIIVYAIEPMSRMGMGGMGGGMGGRWR